MTAREPKLLLDGLCFPEGPRWRRGRLYFSDMHGHEVVAVDLQGQRETIVELAEQPSGLGFLADGSMLVVSMRDRKLMRFRRGELTQFADLNAIATWHCNDMVVDREGRAYVGNFGADIDNGGRPQPAALALVTPDGRARAVADQLLFPNGCAITPDGKTLIIAETFGLRLTAFDIAEDGSLRNRRLWAQLQAAPDGICLDAEGCVWVANAIPPGSFLRVAEGGQVVDRIESKDRISFACMLGGPERKTLFLLEAATLEPARRVVRGNGRIRMVEVDVPGAGWPAWEA